MTKTMMKELKTNQPSTIDHPSIQPSGKSKIVEDQLNLLTANDASDAGNSRNRPEPFGTVLD